MMKKIKVNFNLVIDTYYEFLKYKSDDIIINIELNDLLNLKKDDFFKYKTLLDLIKDDIVTEFKLNNKLLNVSPITDYFYLDRDSFFCDQSFIYCSCCPCFHCKQNAEKFKEITGNEYIPYWQYCEKSFIEKEIFLDLIKDLDIEQDFEYISDISYQDLRFLVNLYNGNSISKNE